MPHRLTYPDVSYFRVRLPTKEAADFGDNAVGRTFPTPPGRSTRGFGVKSQNASNKITAELIRVSPASRLSNFRGFRGLSQPLLRRRYQPPQLDQKMRTLKT